MMNGTLILLMRVVVNAKSENEGGDGDDNIGVCSADARQIIVLLNLDKMMRKKLMKKLVIIFVKNVVIFLVIMLKIKTF